MTQIKDDTIRQAVRENYARIAREEKSGCGCTPVISGGCCGDSLISPSDLQSKELGYDDKELKAVPEGANLGLGCGNPQTIADLKAGECVLDLGSGAGFDSFLAANQVGETGRVIGVDMTHDMLMRARENAEKGGYKNVEFRLGEIEHLPVADNLADVIMSNCVINLSPDKAQVYRDAFRVLKPGGRIAVSDVVALKPIPENIQQDMAMVSGCVGGASLISDVQSMLADAGFSEVQVEINEASREFIQNWAPERGIEDYVASASIQARKP